MHLVESLRSLSLHSYRSLNTTTTISPGTERAISLPSDTPPLRVRLREHDKVIYVHLNEVIPAFEEGDTVKVVKAGSRQGTQCVVIDPFWKESRKKKKLKRSFQVAMPGRVLVRIKNTDLIRSYAPHHLIKCNVEKSNGEKMQQRLEAFLIPRFPSRSKCDEIFGLMTDEDSISINDMLSCMERVHDGSNIKIDMSTMICSDSRLEFNRKGIHHTLTKEEFFDLLTSLSQMYENRKKHFAQKYVATSVPLNRVQLVHSPLSMPHSRCAWCQCNELSHDDHAFWHRKEMRVNFDRWIAHMKWRESRREKESLKASEKASTNRSHPSSKSKDVDKIQELVQNETFNAEIERLKQLRVCSFCLEDAEEWLAQSQESSTNMRVGIPGFSYSILRYLSNRREELSRRHGDVTIKSMWHNETKPRCTFAWWLKCKWGRQNSELWLNRRSLQNRERLIRMKRRHGMIDSVQFTRLHDIHEDLNLRDVAQRDISKYLLTRQKAANKGLLVMSDKHAVSIMQNLLNLGHVVEVRDANRSFLGTSLYRFVDRSSSKTIAQSERVHLFGDSLPSAREVFGQPIVACMSDVLLRRYQTHQFVSPFA